MPKYLENLEYINKLGGKNVEAKNRKYNMNLHLLENKITHSFKYYFTTY